jgi:hypothetical protein
MGRRRDRSRLSYVLYGVADRDPNEMVCEFFETDAGLEEFRRDLPGRYQRMVLAGVAPDDFLVLEVVEEEVA